MLIENYKKGCHWTDAEIQILRDNHSTKTLVVIAEEFFPYRGHGSVARKAEKLGLSRIKAGLSLPFKNSYIMDYWRVPNLINCYLGGFISADGYVGEVNGRKSHIFSIKLSTTDESVIDLFIRELDYKGPKSYRENPCNLARDKTKINKSVGICLYSFSQNAEYLKDYFGIIRNKTFRLAPSNLVNKYLNWAFIIGLYDGDGCVSYCNSSNGKTICPSLIYTSCSENIVNWLKSVFDRFYPSKSSKSKNIRKPGNYYIFTVSGLRAAVIIDYLRQFPIPKLARKWDQPEILEFIENSKKEHPEAFKTLNIAEMNASIQLDYPQPAIINKETAINYAPQT